MQFWKDVISQGMAAANMSLEGIANIDLKQTMSGFEIRTQVMEGAASYRDVTVAGISMRTIEATGTLKLVSVKFWSGGIVQQGETWFYMTRNVGAPHGMLYDPVNKLIYEVNDPPGQSGLGNYLKEKLQNMIDGPYGAERRRQANPAVKSSSYVWDMKNPLDAKKLWGRDSETGSEYIMMPVYIPEAAATTAWFKAQEGKPWDYNIVTKNCAHYVWEGMRTG